MTRDEVKNRLGQIMSELNIPYLPSADIVRKFPDGSKIIYYIYKYGNFQTFANELCVEMSCSQRFTKGKDLRGKRFGKLVAVIPIGKNNSGHYVWKCDCDCGNITTVSSTDLLQGLTQSCGCIQHDMLINRNKNILSKHHLTNHPLYSRWSGMRKRCFNQNSSDYSNYGARGISVCDEWNNTDNGFQNFYEWAINNGWSHNLTLDRIDCNGNYSPQNCRWVTNLQQQRNKRNTIKINYMGKEMSLRDICDENNISYNIVYQRLRNGMDIGNALNKPSRNKMIGDNNA